MVMLTFSLVVILRIWDQPFDSPRRLPPTIAEQWSACRLRHRRLLTVAWDRAYEKPRHHQCLGHDQLIHQNLCVYYSNLAGRKSLTEFARNVQLIGYSYAVSETWEFLFAMSERCLLWEHIMGGIGGSSFRMRTASLVSQLKSFVLRKMHQRIGPGRNLAGHSESPHNLHTKCDELHDKTTATSTLRATLQY